MKKLKNMGLKEKLAFVFESGKSIQFQNEVRRKDGEWYSRIIWKHIQLPNGDVIKTCEWFGFDDIEECVDDCLKYINSKQQLNEESENLNTSNVSYSNGRIYPTKLKLKYTQELLQMALKVDVINYYEKR